ncbi:hypothetical protein EYF80_014669 [Liparis tanakae]|uniref:Uncharacterized protein n=1 Tax=Liparis tanakae TaxID=230148 RepID=A0A4Z2IAN5_9TELE|nr:hypothetical protein EYF80_014669 [Liparis tanakae]
MALCLLLEGKLGPTQESYRHKVMKPGANHTQRRSGLNTQYIDSSLTTVGAMWQKARRPRRHHGGQAAGQTSILLRMDTRYSPVEHLCRMRIRVLPSKCLDMQVTRL